MNASPIDDTVETENEGDEDEYFIATCEHCDGEIMTIVGDDEDTWVHSNTEFTDCPEPVKRKLTKAETTELLDEAVELLREIQAHGPRPRIEAFLDKLNED